MCVKLHSIIQCFFGFTRVLIPDATLMELAMILIACGRYAHFIEQLILTILKQRSNSAAPTGKIIACVIYMLTSRSHFSSNRCCELSLNKISHLGDICSKELAKKDCPGS
ncbi:hypothetical protein SAY87_020443 [Trapa incisa]|uniref:Uncharacterized protein n=1 Tax=Trapa incisa TaxID=236973 RepID=A0AAN7K7S4_9MYRT|nr:hypothetical protein SAY87_020443 [Trapa incisa]